MVKASHLDVSAVVSFVKHFNISPDWHEMQIPHGSSPGREAQIVQCLERECPEEAGSFSYRYKWPVACSQYPATTATS
ncbi:hypothetical protein SPBR_07871 [Sporothrix brasiliensis 5110]|uniref:Uncharacterized protein n=1 Tax=Sporothrix brasiliensis 5110 TaxID=1398154 RepID=A0A0C2ITG3_9PEZI|nr:uncharacterized protein SPBR_07871 [Sporothrix brasiliensis 5110]KIH88317.1 hypothetical protein SPBR_07871 [Sporothrix brasiliensis 5110]